MFVTRAFLSSSFSSSSSYMYVVGRGSSVGITRYGIDDPGSESRWRWGFPHAPVDTGPGAHPASYIMSTDLFPAAKVGGVWRWLPTPWSAEVKERVELYLYSLSGCSCPVLVRTLPFFMYVMFWRDMWKCSIVLYKQLNRVDWMVRQLWVWFPCWASSSLHLLCWALYKTL